MSFGNDLHTILGATDGSGRGQATPSESVTER